MSEHWESQLDLLQTLAEILYRLTSAEQGGDKNLPNFREFRASRVQLRFAQDLITCLQFFLFKEKQLFDEHNRSTLRHGSMGFHVCELLDRSIEPAARYAAAWPAALAART